MSTQWKWRNGEISLKDFYQLKKEEKQEYVQMLEQLPEQELSTGDLYILNFYSNKKINYFTLEEDVVEPVVEDFSDLIKKVPTETTEAIKEYLGMIFEGWYHNGWEPALKFSTATKFINAINNEVKLNDLDKAMIKEYSKRIRK